MEATTQKATPWMDSLSSSGTSNGASPSVDWSGILNLFDTFPSTQDDTSVPAIQISDQPSTSSSSTTTSSQISPHTPADLFPSDDDKWKAVIERNPAADNAFIYIVTTTGIYCRVTCPARRPARSNVKFAPSAAAAAAMGYQPCKRCQPDQAQKASEQRQSEAIASVKGILLEAALHGRKVGLDELSQRVGMSKFHLLRTFKQAVGVSPDAYAKTLRNSGFALEVWEDVADLVVTGDWIEEVRP